METITIIAIIAANIQSFVALSFYLMHKQEKKKNELLNKYYKRRGEVIKKYEKLIDKHAKETYDTVNKTIDEITNPKESGWIKS